MLPTDVSNIINNYNENGVFILIHNTIYWFNEKRLEEWCICTYSKVCTYDHELYVFNDFRVQKFNTRNFKISTKWNHPLKLFSIEQEGTICNNVVYRLCLLYFEMFDGNHITRFPTPNDEPSIGFILSYKDTIYNFEPYETYKFNIFTKKWILATRNLCYIYNKPYLVNGKFYSFIGFGLNYVVYDPVTDVWQVGEKKFID